MASCLSCSKGEGQELHTIASKHGKRAPLVSLPPPPACTLRQPHGWAGPALGREPYEEDFVLPLLRRIESS